MPKIVVSYRRSDTAVIAGRIADQLISRFGDSSVFLDIDNIPFGVDYRLHIKRELAESDLLVVLIGPDWMGPVDGGYRIAKAADPIRVEVETAIHQKVPIIPVLVDEAPMPTAEELPEALAPFAFINAAPVDSGRDFRYHMDRLCHRINEVLGDRGVPVEPQAPRAAAAAPAGSQKSFSWRNPYVAMAAALCVLLAAAAAYVFVAPVESFKDIWPRGEDSLRSFPVYDDRVTDETAYLSRATRKRLSEKLEALDAQTGVQAVVVLLEASRGQRSSDFTDALAQHWRVGGTEQRGVLLVVVPDESEASLYVGSGVSKLNDVAVEEQLLRNVQQRMGARNKDVVGGIVQAIDDFDEVLTNDPLDWLRRSSGIRRDLPEVVPDALPPMTYQIRHGVSGGVQNLREGPAVKYRIIVAIPEGSTGITISKCKNSEDGTKPWCFVSWRGHSGWISSCCLLDEKTGERFRVPEAAGGSMAPKG